MMGSRGGSGAVWLMRASAMSCALWLGVGGWPAAAEVGGEQGSAALRPREVLARAREAVKRVETLHGVIESGDPRDTYVHRTEVWQHGRDYRTDDVYATFVLTGDWAIRLVREGGVALAARRQPGDDAHFLVIEKVAGWLDVDREGEGQSEIRVSERVETRLHGGREELGVVVTRSSRPSVARREDWRETKEHIWADAGTWLPVEFERVSRDVSGRELYCYKARYEYEVSPPEDLFSLRSVVAEAAVVVGWEHICELAEREPIASQVIQDSRGEVVVEVRAIELLPRDYLLVVGFVRGSHPRWLGAHVRRDGGRVYRDFSLAHHGSIVGTAWYGGMTGPPRLPFYMVFAPGGYGGVSGIVPESPRLTFRAWGLSWHLESGERPTVERDLFVKLTLPMPEGPPATHELVRQPYLQ